MELGYSPRAVRELVQEDARTRFRLLAPAADGPAAAGLALSRMYALAGRDLEELP
jgi:hypothetical protein